MAGFCDRPSAMLPSLVKWRWHHCALACIALGAVDRPSCEAAVSAVPDGRVAASAELDLAKARQFWAFQPVRRPDVPQAQGARSEMQNPVDAFVLARLREKGLEPAPRASKGEL